MTDKQESAEVAETSPDALTAEEQAFFESGGEKEIEAKAEPEANAEPEEQSSETEKAESDGKQEQARDEKGKFVPHQALHAEREEHKKTRSELQELKEFRARMEERMQWFEKAAAPKEEAKEETPPDPNEDVFAALKWTQDKLLASEKAQHEATTQQQQYAEAQRQEQAVWNHWDNAARQYAQENPDFPNAAKWLAETRDKQLTALSVADPRFGDVRARNAQIEAELKQIVVAAAQKQMSPAEAVYQIAQSYGYTPQEAAEAAQDPSTVDNALSDKIKRLESAQNASKTVGNAAGKAGGDEITAESLASMPEDEFNRWVAVPENARRFEKLMGG